MNDKTVCARFYSLSAIGFVNAHGAASILITENYLTTYNYAKRYASFCVNGVE